MEHIMHDVVTRKIKIHTGAYNEMWVGIYDWKKNTKILHTFVILSSLNQYQLLKHLLLMDQAYPHDQPIPKKKKMELTIRNKVCQTRDWINLRKDG